MLFVELERQWDRAREDAQRIDLHLHFTRRQVRVHRLGRARDDLSFGLDDELVPDLVRRLLRLRSTLGVDDQLELAGVVAQVDEHQAAVVAARIDPAGDSDAPADVVLTKFAAIEVAPAHGLSVATTSPRATTCSSRPSRRIAASSPRTITRVRAPVRPACVIWPLNDRPA